MGLKYLGGKSKKRGKYCKDGTRKNKKTGKCVKKRKKRRKKRREKRKTKRKRKKRSKNKTLKIKHHKNKNNESCGLGRDKNVQLPFTCYTKPALQKMKNIWNARHPDVKIKEDRPYSIWLALKKNMKSSCDKESCWLKKHWVKEKMDKKYLTTTFATPQPSEWKRKPSEWLTSVDIMGVMRQLELGNKHFSFIGPSPIDFDEHEMYGECVWEELCKFNLNNEINKGKSDIGIIFNLDPHDKPGSHWVSMYISIPKKEICYFDSYGDKMPRRINKLAQRIQSQSLNKGETYKIKENKVRHQYSDSECGMYCLYFIKSLLEGGSFEAFQKQKTPDLKMKTLRNIYFNKN